MTDFMGAAQSKARIKTLIASLPKATGAFAGTLVEVGDPPGFWSGYNIATQPLTYEVDEVFSGDIATGRVTVHQLIVAKSPVALPDTPALKPEYVEVGKRYVVLLGPIREGKQQTFGEGFGPAPASEDLLAQVRAAAP